MADVVKGKLVWSADGKVRRLTFTKKDGTMSPPGSFDPAQLSPSLKATAADKTVAEIDVELELPGGKPVRIRKPGEQWVVAPTTPVRPSAPQLSSTGISPRPAPVIQPNNAPARQQHFVNPYNFVPTGDHVLTGELGDHTPLGHDRLHDGTFTGVLKVSLTTETPLLIVDAANAQDNAGHMTFDVRMVGGQPYLAPTSVKGMLRAAYEAVTNSRMGVFPGHEDRLGLRTAARDSLRLVPARIEGSPGSLHATLYSGTSSIDPTRGPDGPMYAAWLPMYGSFRKAWGPLASHGQNVRAFITRWVHGPFSFWNVVELQPGGASEPTHTPAETRRPWKNARPTGEPGQWVNGYICITNQNIDSKHDERVFFSTRKLDPATPPKPANPTVAVTAEIHVEWANLIRDYQSVHDDEIRRGQAGPPALTRSVWSRHVTGGRSETELTLGTLCHAAVEPNPTGGLRLLGLYPVMISRKLFPASPFDSLPESLRPATNLKELSPADRVFGWVNQDGPGAHRGQLRVGPVTCETADAVKPFPSPGLPLAILGQPKPAQSRFYLGDQQGNATGQHGLTKEQAGYDRKKKLRGRKVYPHHGKLAGNHWDATPSDTAATTNAPGVFREYLRLPPTGAGKSRRDNQNRSITGWVKPQTTFTFDLHVTNLSKVEFGALVWLLSLAEGHFHRLGLGKPLGFGSVRLKIEENRVLDAAGWKQVYGTLDEAEPQTANLEDAQRQFQAVAYQRILATFLAAAKGFNLPTHYPRREPGPNANGEMFEWFVFNEAGPRHALPDLTDPLGPGLPIL